MCTKARGEAVDILWENQYTDLRQKKKKKRAGKEVTIEVSLLKASIQKRKSYF